MLSSQSSLNTVRRPGNPFVSQKSAALVGQGSTVLRLQAMT